MRTQSNICITVLCVLYSAKIIYGQTQCSDLISFSDYGDVRIGRFAITWDGKGANNYVEVKVFVGRYCEPSLCALTMETNVEFANDRYQRGEAVPYAIYFRGASKDAWVEGIGLKTSNNCNIICNNHTAVVDSGTKAMTHSLYLGGKTNSQIAPCQLVTLFANPLMCGVATSDIDLTHLAINGVAIKRGTWPWLAALYNTAGKQPEFICGGTIISQKVILTASHCLFYSNSTRPRLARDVDVVLGRHDLTSFDEGEFIQSQVIRIITHDEYRPNSKNFDADIAMLVTEKDIIFTDYIRQACLYDGPDDPEGLPDTTGVIVGWGLTEEGKLSSVPKAVKGVTVSYESCIADDSSFLTMTTKRNFCARDIENSTQSPCWGDSGGGFFIKQSDAWVVRGIVSATIQSDQTGCDLDKHVVYTNIAKFKTWINAQYESIFDSTR